VRLLKELLLLLVLTHALAGVAHAAAANPVTLGPADLAIVVNAKDSLSQQIGAYYARERHIPRGNIATVSFDSRRDEIPAAEFATLKTAIDRQLNPHVQAYLLTWARPYRVGCRSITSAFAFGADEKNCAAGCQMIGRNPYFNTPAGLRPFDELHLRLAMILPATGFGNAKELIDRGVRADGTGPAGTAYLVTTKDSTRNVRALEYPLASRIAEHELGFHVLLGEAPPRADDVMFYFTGAARVPELASYHFRPGAVADHLTSFGGMLTNSPQMSSLRWLEAGATGSYGTVVEPCNLLEKFPNVGVLLAHYLAGETLIEAYWKSVATPGQGLFLGEPLAAPFRPH
jgi:uncharacterized protein (TIGR03790 family)